MIFPLVFASIPFILNSLRGQSTYALESTIGIPSLPTPTCLSFARPVYQILGS